MSALWTVERLVGERFPYRITIEQGGRVALALRVQDKWPGPGGQIFCLRERPDSPLGDVLETVERVPVASLTRRGRKLSVVLDRARNRRCDFLFTTKAYKSREGEYEQIFFRSQAALRAHRSRGRPQLFGKPRLDVAVDASERYPWRFPDASIRRQRLPVGDYALLHRERVVAVVERKTLDNLLSEIGQVQVLHQQLGELASYPRAALVVEAQYADFLTPKKVRQWRVSHLARVLAEIAALHGNVPIVYAGNRKLGQQWTHGFFAAVAASLEDRPADAVAEVAAPYRPPSAGGVDRAVRHAVLYEFPGSFPLALLRERFPDVPPGRLTRILRTLRAEGNLRSVGRGRGTRWMRDTGRE